MKTALAVFGGFVLSLALFLSGAVRRSRVPTGKPARQAAARREPGGNMDKQPQAVDRASQQFERLPARSAPDRP